MKTLLKFVLFLLPIICLSQGKDTEHKNLPLVKFNFKNPNKIKIPSEIKEGDFYRILIKDINLNRYFISLKASDTVYSKPIEFPTFGSIDLSGLTNLASSITSTVVALVPEATDSIVELEKAKSYDNSFLANKARIFNDIYQIQDLAIKKQETEADKIKKQIAINDLRSLEFSGILKTIKLAIDDKAFEYMEIRVLRKTPENDPSKSINFKNDFKFFESLRSNLVTLKNEIDLAKKSSVNFFENTPKIKTFLADPKNIELKDKFTKSENQISLALKKANTIKDIVSSEKIEQMMVSIMNLYQKNEYKSLPIQFNGEEATVELFFIPKDSSSQLQKYSLMPIRFPRKNTYWSVGSSMYYSNLKSDRVGYKTIRVNDSVSYGKLSMEQATTGELGTALLLRGGRKFNGKWGYHLTVGTGVSISENVLPRALVGGGLSFGKKHNFTLDLGLIFGNVKEVSKSTDFSLEYTERPEVLINQLKTSYFVGIGYSYNL
jgi:hypothetical protein